MVDAMICYVWIFKLISAEKQTADVSRGRYSRGSDTFELVQLKFREHFEHLWTPAISRWSATAHTPCHAPQQIQHLVCLCDAP